MKTVSQYPEGMFSWVDMNSTDVSASEVFYSAIFGWEFETSPIPGGGTYTMFRLNGHDVAGLGGMPPGENPNLPSRWNSYITVKDLSSMVAKAVSLGGQVLLPEMQVMEAGHMAIVMDPTGAVFSMWQPLNHIGSSVVNYPGSLVWNELATRDIDGAVAFYGGLFGWEYHFDDTPEGGYHMFMKDGRAYAGMLVMDEDLKIAWKVSYWEWSGYKVLV